jgi:hypothetical protein
MDGKTSILVLFFRCQRVGDKETGIRAVYEKSTMKNLKDLEQSLYECMFVWMYGEWMILRPGKIVFGGTFIQGAK